MQLVETSSFLGLADRRSAEPCLTVAPHLVLDRPARSGCQRDRAGRADQPGDRVEDSGTNVLLADP
jgi:hypothetical protein